VETVVEGLPAGVRRNMGAAIKAKGAHIRRVNDVLRDGVVQPSDYAVDFPEGSFDTQTPVPGLPTPVDTEAGGALLDKYLTIPSFQ
jgi:hypothetical protein